MPLILLVTSSLSPAKQVREELSFAITQPIAHPALFESMGLRAATGVLLFGPPGCGKTLVAKAVAAESGANFISIKASGRSGPHPLCPLCRRQLSPLRRLAAQPLRHRSRLIPLGRPRTTVSAPGLPALRPRQGPELLNKYVGESERAVRQLFGRARAAAPCVLFFDEMDALAPRRGSDVNQSSERLVNQLLTEMDGVDGRQGVYLVAATNRYGCCCTRGCSRLPQPGAGPGAGACCAQPTPTADRPFTAAMRARPCRPDMIDPALLRPGRLDKILYVPLPPPDGRASILAALTRSVPLAPGVDLAALGTSPRLAGFSGADLAALVREACVIALKERMAQATGGGGAAAAGAAVATGPPRVEARHFEGAMARVQPSVSRKDSRMYEALRVRLRSSRGHLRPEEPTPSEAPPSGLGGGGEAEGGAEGMDASAESGGGAGGNEPMEEQ